LVDHKLAFIGRRDYVEEVRAERRNPECQFYREYLTDKGLRLLAQLGLTLREWENDPARKQDLHELRQRIHKKFGEDGLHIAQVVQSRILTGVIPIAFSTSQDKEQVGRRVEEFLKSSRTLCVFIREEDVVERRVRDVVTRLTASEPPLFVLFGRGSALKTLEAVVVATLNEAPRYRLQAHDLYGSRIVILVRSDLTAKR
jgi:hypothetical protein